MLIKITYRNYRGEVKEYTILPLSVWCGTTPFYPGKQWFLKALHQEAGKEKDFALLNLLAVQVVPQCGVEPSIAAQIVTHPKILETLEERLKSDDIVE